MNSIFFFNYLQKRIIEDSGIALSSINNETLSTFFSEADCYNVRLMSSILCEPNNLLSKFGLKSNSTQEYLAGANNMALPTIKSLEENKHVLNAYVNKGVVLIWVEDDKSNTNNVLKSSALNIAKAFVNVLGFEEFKKQKTFEQLYLLY